MSIGRLDLALDLEAREQRDVVAVHLEPTIVLGGHEALHVLLGNAVCVLLIDEHLADVFREVVAQRAGYWIAFAIDQERSRALEHRLDDFIPLNLEVVEVPLQFFGGPSDSGGAHDRAHAIRNLQGIHDSTHLVAIFTFDTTTDAAGAGIVRHQHQKSAREGDECRQGSALVAALLLFDLNDDVLAFLQHVAHVDARALRLFEEVLAGDFLQRQETMTLGAIVDETGFERWLDP